MKDQRWSFGYGGVRDLAGTKNGKIGMTVLFLVSLLVGACNSTIRPGNGGNNAYEPKVDFTETLIAKVDESRLADKERLYKIIKDLSACIYVVDDNGRHRVKINDRDWGAYDKTNGTCLPTAP